MSAPTPETDQQAINLFESGPHKNSYVSVDFARKLERQRDHLRMAIVKANDLARAGHLSPMDALELVQRELHNGGQP